MDGVRPNEFAQAVAAASPDLDIESKRIAVVTYRLLAKGRPVSVGQIATEADVSAARVEESFSAWPLVFRDEQGRVIGFWGLAVNRLEPTHEMKVDGSSVYGWCAWDTLFVAEILGEEVHVESTDPMSGAKIRLTVTPDAVTDLDPPEAEVSLLFPEEGFDDEAIARFCHKIHFFASRPSAEEWIVGRPGIFSLPVAEAFEVGRLTNRLRLGSTAEAAGSDR